MFSSKLDFSKVLPHLGWMPALLFHALQPLKDNPLLTSADIGDWAKREESGLGDSFGVSGGSPGAIFPQVLDLSSELLHDLRLMSHGLIQLQLSHDQLGICIAYLLFRDVQVNSEIQNKQTL